MTTVLPAHLLAPGDEVMLRELCGRGSPPPARRTIVAVGARDDLVHVDTTEAKAGRQRWWVPSEAPIEVVHLALPHGLVEMCAAFWREELAR